MKFIKGSTPCQPNCWFSGIYKVVCYPAESYRPQTIFYAYFKPHGWKSWGQSVINATKTDFISLEDALEACERHFKTYPAQPLMNNKI
jgi:hypothetical protein